MKWYLIVVMICISLMINDIEQLFMFLLAIYIISFGEMSVKVFAYFLIGLLIFLLLSCKGSLYVLDTRPLSEKWFPNIFSFVVCLFMLLIVFFHGEKFFILMMFYLSTFSLIAYAFGVISKKPLPNPKSWSLCFLLRVL